MALLDAYVRTATGEFTVNNSSATVVSTFSDGLTVTTLENGNWVTVWHDQDNSGTILAQIFNTAGQPVGDLIEVSEERLTPGGARLYQGDPVVAATVDGGFSVAWTTEEYNGGYNTGRNVMTRAFDADGSALGAPDVTILQYNPSGGIATSSWEQQPSLVRLADTGDLALAYYNDLDIGVTILSSDGQNVVTAFPANQVTAEGQHSPHLAALADGGMVVTWVGDDAESGASQGVFARLFASDGTPLGDEFGVNATLYATQNEPRVAALADGGFVVTWYDDYDEHTDGFVGRMMARLYSADGVAQGTEFAVAPDLAAYSYGGNADQDVLALPDGGFLVVFTVAVDNYDARTDIFAYRYAADGTALTGALQLGQVHDSYQGTPRATLLADGQLVVTWYSAEANGRPDGLYAQILQMAEENGTPSEASDFIVLDGTGWSLNLLDGDDTVTGGAGNDRLDGGAGHDNLSGGSGADTLIGGTGDDTLTGGVSTDDLRDVIYGGEGHDSIDGGYGNDELRGDGGNDTIVGGYGTDTVIGGDGDDALTGQTWSDAIFGGAGNDFINGGFGHDRVNGGTGADRFYHLGVEGHGSDWIQDFSNAEGDVLIYGGSAASVDDFQVNFTETASAGTVGIEEAFVIYRPTGQILWALVDGAVQDSIMINIAGSEFDLLG